MAIGPETQAVLTRLDAAANAIRDRITQILADMDLTAEEKAAFDVVITGLTELGTNPNPTPLPSAPVDRPGTSASDTRRRTTG